MLRESLPTYISSQTSELSRLPKGLDAPDRPINWHCRSAKRGICYVRWWLLTFICVALRSLLLISAHNAYEPELHEQHKLWLDCTISGCKWGVGREWDFLFSRGRGVETRNCPLLRMLVGKHSAVALAPLGSLESAGLTWRAACSSSGGVACLFLQLHAITVFPFLAFQLTPRTCRSPVRHVGSPSSAACLSKYTHSSTREKSLLNVRWDWAKISAEHMFVSMASL